MEDHGSSLSDLIGGRYFIKKLIGSGAMGNVYLATGPAGESVALKVLHHHAQQAPDIVARFEREAKFAAKINSPFVARVLKAGRERSGRLWIAFEYLEGEGLDHKLARQGRLSFSDVCWIIDDILSGLVDAHSAQIIHRDIKPANLFIEKKSDLHEDSFPIGRRERARILDFGISKRSSKSEPLSAAKEKEASLTGFDATLGNFAYMAPEQIRGSALTDERADLYAVGAVAFRMLSGRLPFQAQSALSLVALKREGTPPTLRSITGEIWDESLEFFLKKILDRERVNRFSSSIETLEAWRQTCRNVGDGDRVCPPMAFPPFSFDETSDDLGTTEVSLPEKTESN